QKTCSSSPAHLPNPRRGGLALPKIMMWTDYSCMSEKDYVLGTHDEELIRLGLQHRVWRPIVLDCWQRAGITIGKRVLDLGAGPGYAALDLAEIVGFSGEV